MARPCQSREGELRLPWRSVCRKSPRDINTGIPKVGGGVFLGESSKILAHSPGALPSNPSFTGGSCYCCSSGSNLGSFGSIDSWDRDWRSLSPWYNWSGQELCECNPTPLNRHLSRRLVQRNGSLNVNLFSGWWKATSWSLACLFLPLVTRTFNQGRNGNGHS